MITVAIGTVVQLDPEKTGNKMFAGCFMVVSEVKSWGVQGYVQSLGENGEPGGQAYYRAVWGTFERILPSGIAPWVIGSASERVGEKE